MRALVLQHDHLCPPGFVGERLIERGYELSVHLVVPPEHPDRPGVPADFPALAGVDLVVAMGAPWSAYDPAVASWVEPELALLREADGADIPVLGICFGGQLLAAAHGGVVARATTPEIGWYEVSLADPSVPDGPWFHWHFDAWTLPVGATELGRSAAASQAFRLRRNLALQFHPEIDEVILGGWLGDEPGEVERHGLDPRTLLARTRELTLGSRRRAHALVDGFLERSGLLTE